MSLALAWTVERSAASLRADRNDEPTHVEITFGPLSLEALDRQVLAKITRYTSIAGLPVSFPEEPGAAPRAVTITVYANDWKATHLVTPELLNDEAVSDHPGCQAAGEQGSA